MKFKFSWLNSRKILFFSSLFDFVLCCYLFFDKFKYPILNDSILLFLSIINPLIWVISSYIFGRYTFKTFEKYNIFLTQFIKTLFVIFLNLLFTQILFRIFWDWNYLNFESFSNYLNDLSSFYIKVFILSGFSQSLAGLYFSKKNTKSSNWLFLGNNDSKKYLKKLIGNKSKFKIITFNQKYLSNHYLKPQGIIIDEEEILKKKNIQFLFDLNNKGMKFMKISNWCERYLNRYPPELVKGTEIIGGKFSYDENSLKARIKRIYESILSILILILTLPIIIFASLLIKFEDGGPILYTQSRTGFEGKKFKIIKLRTMIIDAEKKGAQWAARSDSRITKIGKILRKLRIDELPQLLLVLSGEMSLIGPRPERPKIDILLRETIPNYDLRYSIKPGISGWAQVNYPYGASIDDSKYKLSYDIYYIKNFSILLDCMIFFKTLRLVINGKGSIPIKK